MTSEQKLEWATFSNAKAFSKRPPKHELIRGIVFVLKQELAKLSYDDVQEFAKDIKLLEDTDDRQRKLLLAITQTEKCNQFEQGQSL